MSVRNDKRVMVCDHCLTASCWYGEFMCQRAVNAGTKILTAGELRKLNREHPDNWTAEKFISVYGTATPEFAA